jgi:hypothetical protein
MTFNFRQSPKNWSPQLQAGEKVASRARASSDGSPRRRWSPVKLSPSLRRRPKKYAHLKLSPTDRSDENGFKENESPLGTLSLDSIPKPMPHITVRQRTPPSGTGINLSLPPPSPSARRSRTPIRAFTPSRLTVETADSINIHEECKREPTSSRKAEVSPIFRLNVQPAASGIETMLAHENNTVTLADTAIKLNFNRVGQDDFAELINSRQETARLNAARKASTELHEMCYGISTLDDVMRAQSYLIRCTAEKDSIADCVSNTDHKGRTPIHTFSENKALATAVGIPNEFDYETREYVKLYQQPTCDPESNLEKHVTRFLISDLLAAYPGAMMCRDRDNRIPFEYALTEWVLQSRDNCQDSNEPETGYLSNLASYTTSVSRAWGSTSTTILSAVKLGARRGTRNPGDPIASPTSAGGAGSGVGFDWNDPKEALARASNDSAERSSDRMKSSIIAPSVRLTPYARFALMMLSAIVDQLDHYMSPELFRSRSSRVRNKLGCGSREEFERVLKRVRTFRDIYGFVDISSAVVQSSK